VAHALRQLLGACNADQQQLTSIPISLCSNAEKEYAAQEKKLKSTIAQLNKEKLLVQRKDNQYKVRVISRVPGRLSRACAVVRVPLAELCRARWAAVLRPCRARVARICSHNQLCQHFSCLPLFCVLTYP
jgi:hypothetical protein